MNKQDRAAKRGIERRTYAVQLQVRKKPKKKPMPDGDMPMPDMPMRDAVTVDGYATVTESPFEMWDPFGSYSEIVRGGAFGKTLAENPQVQLLLNHGGLSMAYTRAGTLRLAEDSTGLHISADVNPIRHDVGDMLTALEDGDVDEMSFAFRVTRQQWSPDYDQRDILEVDMHRGDVSIVNFGANPATSVSALRSQDWDRMSDVDARALYERLGRRFAPVPAAGLSLDLARAMADRDDSRVPRLTGSNI